MCNQLSQFAIEKYVHLKGFLDIDNCKELTAELKQLVSKQGPHERRSILQKNLLSQSLFSRVAMEPFQVDYLLWL